ncbi:M61 family metallopeptidase [Pedobacter sp. SD-b]|uniref:M61 family metallopeptidase n=1 Tax=Pedobacter segetis TaxID=2793069 RepID=A0ABS1BEW2_9SPHI|nr:PDZ domain-containing protein [Pedobacter segetis]MBK0381409.1 M61 family metallopeptidase [Pedobacter segetis]
MKKIFTFLIFLGFVTFLKAQSRIQYTVSFENAAHHEANISMNIAKVPNGKFLVRMSRSSPGRYATHEFGKNIYDVHAYNSDGKEIQINQVEGDVYEVPEHQSSLKINYTLFGNLVDGTYTAIDTKHFHLNMPATFMWAPALQTDTLSIKFIVPDNFKIATQLTLKNGLYYAPNLQYFMDSPVEISNYTLKSWEVENKDGLKQKISIVYHGAGSDSTLNDFESKVKNIVNQERAVYGDLPKYDHGEYKFLIDVLPSNDGDGMEHRNSTIITKEGENLETSEYGVLSTVAHEYFHSWNVERMRPKTLEPFNFEKANMSDALWFAEGFTQYYGNLILKRANIKSSDEFVETQGAYLNAVLNSPGANTYSPIFMSQRAVFVDAGVAVDQTNYPNIFSSYYIYGDITALALDLTLREQFGKTLDDYMRAVWVKYGKTEIAYSLEDLQQTLAELTESQDFAKKFFLSYIYGTEKADYKTLLAKAGYLLKRSNTASSWIGNERLIEKDGKIVITSPAIKGSPLYLAGLDAGDTLLKFNDIAISGLKIMPSFLKATAGTKVKVTFERDGKIHETSLTFLNDPNLEVISFEKAGMAVTPEITAFRENWMGNKQ